MDRAGVFTGGAVDAKPSARQQYLGGRFGGIAYGVFGVFAALDMRTNTLVWQQQWPERCYSGSVSTASGLLFVGRGDGRFTALDSRSGALLWQFQTGAGVNAPASVFEHRGRQHVVVYSAGNLFAGSARGDSVWLFSLDGTLGPVQPGSDAAAPSITSAARTEPDLASGRLVYESTCSPCHGGNGEGGHGGGPALAAATNRSAIARVVTEGRNQMPPFGRTLSADQIRDVSAYVADRLPH
jgi:alcohol dehydrogenase (cytochrome c)